MAPIAEYHDRESWLQARQGHLTASDMAVIYGVHPFKDELQLQQEKLGLLGPQEENLAMKRGRMLEEIAVARWEEETGRSTRRTPFRSHPEYPIIACSADRLALSDETHPTRPLEIKVPGYAVFEKIRSGGLRDYMAIQGQVQAFVHGKDATEFGILHADSFRLLAFPVEADTEFHDDMVPRALAWWDKHIVQQEPVEGPPEDVKLPDAPGGELIERVDEEFNALVDQMVEVRELRDESTRLYTELQESMKELLGEKGAFQGAKARIYYQTQAGRASLDKPALRKFLAEHGKTLEEFEKVGRGYTTLRLYQTRGAE